MGYKVCILLQFILVFIARPIGAEPTVVKNWGQMLQSADLEEECLAADGSTLVVVAQAKKEWLPLLSIKNPPLEEPWFGLRGLVAYENVTDPGYLHAQFNFGEAGVFFTKSLAPDGPMGLLQGSVKKFRPFVLPFDTRGSSMGRPQAILLGLCLPSGGTVRVKDVELVAFSNGDQPLAWPRQSSWIEPRVVNLAGAVLGSVFGILGACIGYLSSRGRARGIVMGIVRAVALTGSVLLGLGICALVRQQPGVVSWGLCLTGGLMLTIFGGLQPTLQKRYTQLELRRMQAEDLTDAG